MSKKGTMKRMKAKLEGDLDEDAESFNLDGKLEDSMTESDDDELKDDVPELFEDPAKNREAVLKTLQWTEKDIDPE